MTRYILGIDEVGKGCIAGPLVLAGVVLRVEDEIADWCEDVNDSKKLSQKKRDELSDSIKTNSVEWIIKECPASVIDRDGIVPAQHELIYEIIRNIKSNVNEIITDFMKGFELDREKAGIDSGVLYKNEIDGDEKYKSVAAASIIAKVYRDHYMYEQALKYPQYGFERHVGYGTSFHIDTLKKHGPCALHRMTFEPVKSIVSKI